VHRDLRADRQLAQGQQKRRLLGHDGARDWDVPGPALAVRERIFTPVGLDLRPPGDRVEGNSEDQVQTQRLLRHGRSIGSAPDTLDLFRLGSAGALAGAPSSWSAPVRLTHDLLQGRHPQDPAAQRDYDRTLAQNTDLDADRLTLARHALNYRTLARELQHRSADTVSIVIARDASASSLIKWCRSHQGRLPINASAFLAHVTPDSARRAVENGLAEQVGPTLIWQGKYHSVYRVGLP